MKNKRRILGVITAIALAATGTFALVSSVQSAKDKAAASEALVDVYVVDELVPKGATAETIRSSVSLERIPARLEQPGAIADLDDVGANVAATDLQLGDQLLAARLVPKDQVTQDVTDKVQISAVLASERAVGGTLQEGDLVGVYLSFDPFNLDEAGGSATETDEAGPAESEKSPNITRLEFQHVLITNVQTTEAPIVSEEADEERRVEQVTGAQYVVTLALSPEQSERFVFATEFGHVWLSSDPATVPDDGTRPVTLGNVYTVLT